MSERPPISGLRLLRLLGEGGMGRVYLAEDIVLGRRTAVKVLSDKSKGDPDASARFLREARAMAALEHPHVVRVYAFGEAEGSPYLVMEYVQGESLAERIAREGPLGLEQSLRIVLQVVDGLEAAWEAGLIHRDVKPSNLLLDRRGEVRVADFGLAKPLQREADGTLTSAGAILGTPHYISPEQALGRAVDFRTDIYSLGIVLYEMLTGARPFRGTTPVEIVAQHLYAPLPSPLALRPDIPADVIALLEAMTAKEPSQRPQSHSELRARVRACQSGEAPVARTQPAGRRAWRRRLRPALAAVLLALAVAAFWWRWPDITRPIPARVDERFRLVIAVAPFGGPDEDSLKEGRLMAALVEKAVAQRLTGGEVEVLGVERTGVPVRDHASARELGARLGSDIVVWGEVLALRGESEIQPYFTLVPRKREPAPGRERRTPADRLDPRGERAAETVRLGAGAPSQIDARRTGAAGIGDLVLVLAGVHALYVENRPPKALALFEQAPLTSETLRYRAECLLRLGRREAAREILRQAVALDPGDSQAWAALGDAQVEDGLLDEAFDSYLRPARATRPWSARQGMAFEGKLYVRETAVVFAYGPQPEETGYLLAIDPDTGTVVERHRLPLSLASLSLSTEGLEVACATDDGEVRVTQTLTLVGGRFRQPEFLGGSLWFRRKGIAGGQRLGAPFEDRQPDGTALFRPRAPHPGAPQTLPELEAALRAERTRDPTQPWTLFYLGEAAWWQGRRDEAVVPWTALFAAGSFPGIPYYEYAHMAAGFERLGQREWADRAHAEAVARWSRLGPARGPLWLIERLINTPYASAWAMPAGDLERRHVWLLRAREFGLLSEGEDLAAAAWERHFRREGRLAEADAEAKVARQVRADPLNPTQLLARFDYVLELAVGLGLALAVALVALAANVRRRRGRGTGLVRHLLPGERRTLVVASLLTALALAALLPIVDRVSGIASLPFGFGDSFGSASIRADLERLVSRADTPEGRFVLAVASHVAGDVKRARTLYEGLPRDPRARRNLEALRAGTPLPPETIRREDLLRAYASFRWLSLPSRLEEAARAAAGDLMSGRVPDVADLGAVALAVALPLLAFVLVLVLAPARPRALSPVASGTRGNRSFSSRVVPGLSDLRSGRPGCGYVKLLGATTTLAAIGGHALAMRDSGVGLATSSTVPSVLRAFGLPERSFGDSLWVYRDAPWFWSVVGVLAATSIALHLLPARSRGAVSDAATSDTVETRTHPSAG